MKTINLVPDCKNGTAFDAQCNLKSVGRVYHVHQSGWHWKAQLSDPRITIRLWKNGKSDGGPCSSPEFAKNELQKALQGEL